MWIYIFTLFFAIYALFKEREALGCFPNPLDGKDCDNKSGKAIIGSHSTPDNSTPEILDNIVYASTYDNRFVRWRGVFLVSLIGTLLLWFVIFQKFPSEWELVCGVIVLFLVFSCIDRFYLFHVSKCIKENIDESVNILQDRYYEEHCTEGYKDYQPYHKLDYLSHGQTPFLV